MGKIVISENVSLDGVVQDPAGVEGFGRGGSEGGCWSQYVGDSYQKVFRGNSSSSANSV